MEVTRPIDTLEDIRWCVTVRWSSNAEVDHFLRRGSINLEQGGLDVRE